MRYITGSIVITILLVGTFAAHAQPGRPGANAKIIEKTIPVKILDPANDFADNGLPEPPVIPDGRSDASAAKLAAKLSKYEDDSLAYLIAVLQKAGFYIIDENRKILYQPTVDLKGMGLAFYDYEVVGMLKLSRGGVVTSVGKLADVIAKDLPPPLKQQFGAMMLQDLRKAAALEVVANEQTSNKAPQTKRFWAKLIIELGKQFPTPVDLMTATPEAAQLNIIQASLWQRRLVGDLIAFNEQQGIHRKQPTDTLAGRLMVDRPFEFLNASLGEPVIPQEPCNYANEESLEVDVAATGLTTVHGTILGGFVDAAGDTKTTGGLVRFEKVGLGLGVASAVLNWAKLVAAASQMKGEIKVEEPMPLIRTKYSNIAGQRRTLTGKFEIKVNNLRQLNCVRTTLNMTTGLDFSMPSSGPLADKPVSWELSGETSFFGQGSSKTGQYEQIVYLLPIEGANRDHHKQETDASGESKIYLEGAKQKKDLNGLKLVPLPKKAIVRADVALKNMKDTKQEVADVAGFTIGTATGGGSLLGLLGSIPEIGFRMKIPVKAVAIPVRDWTPCSADWGGWITVTRKFEQTIAIKGNRLANGNTTGDGVRRISRVDEAEITLNPRKPEEMQTQDPKPALIALRGKHSDISDLYRPLEPCCGNTEGKFTTRIRRGEEMEYNQIVRERFHVGYRGSERDYELDLGFGSSEGFPAKLHKFVEVIETNCELDEGFSKESDTLWLSSFTLTPGRYPYREVNSEGEFLFGTKDDVKLPDGSKEVWTWALARCRD